MWKSSSLPIESPSQAEINKFVLEGEYVIAGSNPEEIIVTVINADTGEIEVSAGYKASIIEGHLIVTTDSDQPEPVDVKYRSGYTLNFRGYVDAARIASDMKNDLDKLRTAPVLWSRSDVEISDELKEAVKQDSAVTESNVAVYYDDTAASRVRPADELQSQAHALLYADPTLETVRLDIAVSVSKDFWVVKSVPGFEGHTFLIPDEFSGGTFILALRNALSRFDAGSLPSDKPYIFMPAKHILSKDGEDVHGHLAGDCVGNGIIPIDVSTVETVDTLNNSTDARIQGKNAGSALLELLLEHEIHHEATGQTGPGAEMEFTAVDIDRFRELLGNDNQAIVDAAVALEELNVISSEFRDEILESIVEFILKDVQKAVKIDFWPATPWHIDLFINWLARGIADVDELFESLEWRFWYFTDPVKFGAIPSAAQAEAVANAQELVDENLRVMGYATPPPVDVRYAAEGYYGPAQSFPEIHTILLPVDASTPNKLEYNAVHEFIHAKVYGLPSSCLNEGMTEYLATRFLMEKAGNRDFSLDSMKAFRRLDGLTAYNQKLAVITYAVDTIGLEPLLDAYFTGDTTLIEKAMGRDKWQELIDIAYESDKTESIFLPEEIYLEEMEDIFNSIAPATWSQDPNGLPDGFGPGVYREGDKASRMTDDEISGLRNKAGNLDWGTLNDGDEVALNNDTYVVKIASVNDKVYRLLIEKGSVFSDGARGAILEQALAQAHEEGLTDENELIFIDAEYIISFDVQKGTYTHLAGDELQNSFLAFKKNLPDIIDNLNSRIAGMGDILLQVLAEHELRHENESIIEPEFLLAKKDIERLIALSKGKGVSPILLAYHLGDLSLISDEFQMGILMAIAKDTSIHAIDRAAAGDLVESQIRTELGLVSESETQSIMDRLYAEENASLEITADKRAKLHIYDENGTLSKTYTYEPYIDSFQGQTMEFTDSTEHDAVYHMIKEKTDSGEWDKDYTLINFDRHSDDFTPEGYTRINPDTWAAYAHGLVGRYWWVHSYSALDAGDTDADITTSYEHMRRDLPASEKPVIVTIDLDYFISNERYHPSKTLIDTRIKDVVRVLRDKGYNIKALNITRSPSYIIRELEDYTLRKLAEELKELPGLDLEYLELDF